MEAWRRNGTCRAQQHGYSDTDQPHKHLHLREEEKSREETQVDRALFISALARVRETALRHDMRTSILYKTTITPITSSVQRLDLATRSNSSFFLIAYEFEEPYIKYDTDKHYDHKSESQTFAALISSSARHSAMLLMFLNAASLAPNNTTHQE